MQTPLQNAPYMNPHGHGFARCDQGAFCAALASEGVARKLIPADPDAMCDRRGRFDTLQILRTSGQPSDRPPLAIRQGTVGPCTQSDLPHRECREARRSHRHSRGAQWRHALVREDSAAVELPQHKRFVLVSHSSDLLLPAHPTPPQARRVPLDRRPSGRHQPLHRRPQCQAQTLRLDPRSRDHPRQGRPGGPNPSRRCTS